MRLAFFGLAASALVVGCNGEEPVSSDIAGRATASAEPRLVTLAPHLAEIAVVAGAEPYLVGVSAYTDFPPRLTALPVVSDGFQVDAEAMLAVRPTRVLAWGGGGQARSVALVEELGLTVETIESRSIADVSQAIRRLGEIAGTTTEANEAAETFDRGIDALTFEGERLSVFYQISERPLYTVNGEHVISELIERCGGDNVFAELGTLAPTVSVEAVVRADPDVVLSSLEIERLAALRRRWPEMTAVQKDGLRQVPGDLVNRSGPRLVEGGQAICAALDAARAAR